MSLVPIPTWPTQQFGLRSANPITYTRRLHDPQAPRAFLKHVSPTAITFVGTSSCACLGMFEDCSSCPSDPDAGVDYCWFWLLCVVWITLGASQHALTVLLLVLVIRAFSRSYMREMRETKPSRRRLGSKVPYSIVEIPYAQ